MLLNVKVFMFHHSASVACLLHNSKAKQMQKKYIEKPRPRNVSKTITKEWCNMEQSLCYTCDRI